MLLIQKNCRASQPGAKPKAECVQKTDPVLEALYSMYSPEDIASQLQHHTKGQFALLLIVVSANLIFSTTCMCLQACFSRKHRCVEQNDLQSMQCNVQNEHIHSVQGACAAVLASFGLHR